MAKAAPVLLGLLALVSSALGTRVLASNPDSRVGRRLLGVDFGVQTSPFYVQASVYDKNVTDCYIYSSLFTRDTPPNQQSPVNVQVPVGTGLVLSTYVDGAHGFTNYTVVGAKAQTTVSDGYIIFNATSVGLTSTVTRGLRSTTSCYLTITFTAVAPPGSPCSGAVPCYCQNGYCFNNGATLTNTCAPPSGQVCTQASVNPASIGPQYAGYSNPVNVCRCNSTTTVG